MAALVQSLPSQTSIMMQRPDSAERYHSGNGSQHNLRNQQKHSNFTSMGYRGASGPAPAYAFTSTPQLSNSVQRLQQLQQQPRAASSSSIIPQLPQLNLGGSPDLSQRPPQLGALPSFSTGSFGSFTHDDANITTLPVPATNTNPKPSPDRYRRNVRRSDSGENVPTRNSTVGQIYQQTMQSANPTNTNVQQPYRPTPYSATTQPRNPSNEDLSSGRSTPDLASRYRRRSFVNIEVAGLNHTGDSSDMASPHPNALMQGSNDYLSAQVQHRPSPSHAHTASSDSITSVKSGRSSRPSSSRQDSSNPSTPPSAPANSRLDPRALNVHARPQEVPRRQPSPLSNSSPLSRPMNIPANHEAATTNTSQRDTQPVTKTISPAAEHLAALNSKEMKKPKSKLRRAFSFGSAAELRKVTAQANHERTTTTTNKRLSKYEDEMGMEPEQARIAEKQEAAGLGESIYSGQGHFFTGSTDNLSISSTASSASVMLRKMGKGVKKGTRSLVGLFRPKSVLGVPAADGPVNEAAAAQVSMLTVEAEREKVNVNVNPHDQIGGGTGFPKLERNSVENKISLDSGSLSQDSRSRRSIVGGEKERAEVLAAVKKGILKRADSSQSSPSLRPADSRPNFALPNVAHINASPKSSAPSTPVDEHTRSGHRRTDSITIESSDPDDYFSQEDRYESLDSKTNVPLTPQATARNISFSPRIQFHDTWPSGEYDRRGEIATCNRLTPMLAQQIKEELNTFKMVSLSATDSDIYMRLIDCQEMEVHESSKVYTHFF